MYVVMIAMVLLMAVSLLILYGTIMERKGLLVLGVCLLTCVWLLEFIGAIVVCLYGVEESKVLTRDLNKTFLRLIYNYDEDPRAARIMKIVQEYVSGWILIWSLIEAVTISFLFLQVGCCGAKGSEDYTNARKPVPYECRDRVEGNEYRYGCTQQGQIYFQKNILNQTWRHPLLYRNSLAMKRLFDLNQKPSLARN